MVRWMKSAFTAVALTAASAALAGTPPNDASGSTPEVAPAEEVRHEETVPAEVRELRKEVEQLQKTLSELREQVRQVPQYLDQTNSPITGS
jgi:TolA-binding protein